MAAAWQPLRDGLFSCLAASTACVASFTADLRARLRAAAKPGHVGGRALNKGARCGHGAPCLCVLHEDFDAWGCVGDCLHQAQCLLLFRWLVEAVG